MRAEKSALWSAFSVRHARERAALGVRTVLRAACVLMVLMTALAVLTMIPEFLPKLVYYSAAAGAPGAFLEALNQKWAPEPEFEPEYESAAPETDEHLSSVLESAPPSSSLSESREADENPEEVPKERRGTVLSRQYSYSAGGMYLPFGEALIRNDTELSNEKLALALEENLSLGYEHGSSEPQVLIIHTHATESFEPADRGYYDVEASWRSTDNSNNMVAVGDVLEEGLLREGVSVLHDATQHDNPSYNGSYERSAETIKGYLAQYPSIKVILDLHRDAIEPEAGVIVKPTVKIHGRNAAQVMIISGCDDGTMNMPGYFNNLRFAGALAGRLEAMYPGLTRPVLFAYRKYNMDLSGGLLLIEVGSSGNTIEEAEYSAEMLAAALASLLEDQE